MNTNEESILNHSCPFVTFVAAFFLLFISFSSFSSFAATPEQIDQSIGKAKEFLYAQQKNGNWEVVAARKDTEHGRIFGSEYGGMTAIATYALLSSGEKASDPRLAKSIEWLAKADMVG